MSKKDKDSKLSNSSSKNNVEEASLTDNVFDIVRITF